MHLIAQSRTNTYTQTHTPISIFKREHTSVTVEVLCGLSLFCFVFRPLVDEDVIFDHSIRELNGGGGGGVGGGATIGARQ